jgi:WASH complex subunit 7
VPALCISWIDASLLAKDGMYKTTRGVTKEMYFTDDGFPVGIAYCLAILKQVGLIVECCVRKCGGSCLL